MSISKEEKIDLNQIIGEFVQNCVNEDVDSSKTTDPTVKRVRVIKPDPFC